jgi:hypothetical protein
MRLGEEYKEVHLWLDEYAKKYPIHIHGPYHRQFRHNREGVEEVRKKWGNGGARAAEFHILFDMGCIPERTIDAFKAMLEEAEEDIRKGRVRSQEDVFNDIEASLKSGEIKKEEKR